MSATTLNITIEQGATYSMARTVGTGYNTWTGRGKIVDAFGGNVLADFTVATVSAGVTTISLTAAQTTALVAPSSARSIDREVVIGYYDIELVNALTSGATVARVLQGTVTLSREVTT